MHTLAGFDLRDGPLAAWRTWRRCQADDAHRRDGGGADGAAVVGHRLLHGVQLPRIPRQGNGSRILNGYRIVFSRYRAMPSRLDRQGLAGPCTAKAAPLCAQRECESNRCTRIQHSRSVRAVALHLREGLLCGAPPRATDVADGSKAAHGPPRRHFWASSFQAPQCRHANRCRGQLPAFPTPSQAPAKSSPA